MVMMMMDGSGYDDGDYSGTWNAIIFQKWLKYLTDLLGNNSTGVLKCVGTTILNSIPRQNPSSDWWINRSRGLIVGRGSAEWKGRHSLRNALNFTHRKSTRMKEIVFKFANI